MQSSILLNLTSKLIFLAQFQHLTLLVTPSSFTCLPGFPFTRFFHFIGFSFCLFAGSFLSPWQTDFAMPQIQFMVLFSSSSALINSQIYIWAWTSALNSKLLYSISLLGCLMDSSNFTPPNSILIFVTLPDCFPPKFPYFSCWQLQIFQLLRPETLESSIILKLLPSTFKPSALCMTLSYINTQNPTISIPSMCSKWLSTLNLDYYESPNHSPSLPMPSLYSTEKL